MMDLIEKHRKAVAQAGLDLATAINAATNEYNEAVSASDLALKAAMDIRIRQFEGVGAEVDEDIKSVKLPPATVPPGFLRRPMATAEEQAA